MGQRFERRGKRTDEMLRADEGAVVAGVDGVLRRVLPAPRMEMEPTPPRIPVYVGGLSDIALRRAARHDGWIGDLITTDKALERVSVLRRVRAEKGLSMDGFEVITPLTDAFTPEHYETRGSRWHHGIITMPWMFYSGPAASLDEKIDGMRRFRKDLRLNG